MADNELQVRIGADYSALKLALGKSQKSVKDFAATFHDVQGGIQATIANVQRFIGAVQSFIAPAIEAEKSVADLTAALRSQGVTSTKVRDEILKFSSAMQRQTTYGDEAITEVQKLLFQLGKLEGEGLQRATKATLDLAAGLGIDLHSAAMMVGKAAAGNTTTLGRYGIQIAKTGDEAKDFAKVLGQLEGKFGGAAAAATETTAGAFAQFKEATGELAEAIGSKLLPSLSTAARFWRDLAFAASDAVGGSSENTNAAAKNAELLASAMGKIADKSNQYLQAQQFLTTAEVEAIRQSNLKISAYKNTGATLQDLLPKLEKLIAMNRETAAAKEESNKKEEAGNAVAKQTGLAADAVRQALANLDAQGDATAAQILVLKDREKELRGEMEKLVKAGERVPPALLAETVALNEQITALERAKAREEALARVKDQAAASELARAEALKAENEEKRKAVALDAARALAYEKAIAANEANSEAMKRQQVVMAATTTTANALGQAIVAIAIDGENAADVMRQTFRQLAAEIIRQAIAMIVAKAGEAASKTVAANAGVPGPAGIALALGGGAAIFAATMAYKNGIPGFAEGGLVGGPGGRDRVLARLTRGEEVLTQDDPRHQNNGGGAPTFNFYSVFPADQTQMEQLLRDDVMPVWRRLVRNNM